MGDGSSPLSLSRTGIRRTPSRGLPASRRHSPRQAEFPASWQGRPAFRNARILSEAFQLASAGGCATGLQTRSRHACDLCFRVLTISTGSAAAGGSAFAQRHGSRLFTLKLLFIHSPAVPFLASPAFGSFSRGLPSLRGLPGADAHFVPPFGVFRLADPTFYFCSRQSHPSVLIHSSNLSPSG